MKAAIAFVILFGAYLGAQQSPKPLFRAVTTSSPKVGVLMTVDDDLKLRKQGIVRRRLVTFDGPQLSIEAFSMDETGNERPHRLRINFFDDNPLSVLIRSATRQEKGLLLSGTIVERPLSSVELITRGKHLTGNVITGDGNYFQIRPASDDSDVHVVEQLDPGRLPAELPPLKALPSKVARDLGMSTDDGSVIDVMVLYTKAARLDAGGTDAMLGLISLAEHDANESYANSGVLQRIRIVHSEEVNFDPAATFGQALEALSDPSDPQLRYIHQLRDRYGADMVSLWITNLQSCGLGYLYSDGKQDFSESAFSVVNWHCAVFPSQWSFAHELGHNQGTEHDRRNANKGLYLFSFGYQQTRNSPYCRTIEAYPCDDGISCPRVNLWSNPDIKGPCSPLGVAKSLPDAADDRETLNQTRVRAARWRNSTVH